MWCESVLLPEGWGRDVMIGVDTAGNICSVRQDVSLKECEGQCAVVRGTVVPGVPNCHSHAHQRAMAGLGETRPNGARSSGIEDSFWSWREVMYRYLERIEPPHLYAISRQLYLEMLKAGYTSVAEFQYLHHDPRGHAYTEPAVMTLSCLQAASSVGIGFTALPVLYRFGGFGGQPPLEGQKRFVNDQDRFCTIVTALVQATEQHDDMVTGIAPHSLRAVTAPLLRDVLTALSQAALSVIHLHIAEQVKEVEDCIAWSGRRPVEWLFDHFEVDPQWSLIHATHMSEAETGLLARSGAVAGLCPTTEANLGDGFFNAPTFQAEGGIWAIGSDSHISMSPVEELRWLEYGQRLLGQRRNVMQHATERHTGTALYRSALLGGARSCGRKIGQVAQGFRADLVVLNTDHPRFSGRAEDDLMNSWLFSGNENPVQDVYIGGKQVIANGRHHDEESIRTDYLQSLHGLAE